MLTKDKARRIAANIAKPPQAAAAEATGLYRTHFRYDLNSGHFAGLRSLTSWARNESGPATYAVIRLYLLMPSMHRSIVD
jgi:hypothetical protein